MKLDVSFDAVQSVSSFPLVSNPDRDTKVFQLLGKLVYEFSIVEHCLKQAIQIMLQESSKAKTFEAAFSEAEGERKFASIAELYCKHIIFWNCPSSVSEASIEIVKSLTTAYEHRNDLVHGVISHHEDDRYYLLRSKLESRSLKQWRIEFSIGDVEKLVRFVNFSRIGLLVPFKDHPQPPGWFAAISTTNAP